MQIMETNIGPEPVCHGHEIVNNGNDNVWSLLLDPAEFSQELLFHGQD